MKLLSLAVTALLFALPLSATDIQYNASWGLDRVDQRSNTLDTQYIHDFTGSTVIIYVLDDGVHESSDLTGRVSQWSGYTTAGDRKEHGTAVAGIAAGTLYGVAKNATIVDVPVIGADPTAIVQALQDIATYHPANKAGVVNISWTDDDQIIADAVVSLAGTMPVVIAATNYGSNACSQMLAGLGSYDGIIVVSAVVPSGSGYARQSGAGTGSCIDLFAPSGVPAKNWNHASSTEFLDNFQHTSSAAPFVAGAAAILLEQYKYWTPAEVENLLKSNATKNILASIPTGTTNALLYTRVAGVGATPTVQDKATVTAATTPISGATYQWTVANGTISGSSTGSSITFVAGCSGIATPQVTVTLSGATTSGAQAVTILPPYANTSGSTTINSGQSATIYATLAGNGPWTVWWNDDVITTHATSPASRVVSPTSTFTYRAVAVRDDTNCYGTVSGSAKVTVQ